MTRTRTSRAQQASRDTSCGFVQPCSPKHRHSHHSVCKENIKLKRYLKQSLFWISVLITQTQYVLTGSTQTTHGLSWMKTGGGGGGGRGYLLTARAKRSDPQRPERPPATAGTVDVEAVGTSPLSAKQLVSSAPCSVGSSAEQSHKDRVRTTSC